MFSTSHLVKAMYECIGTVMLLKKTNIYGRKEREHRKWLVVLAEGVGRAPAYHAHIPVHSPQHIMKLNMLTHA